MQLSICIPTFNRAESLTCLLQAICTDAEYHGLDVEVVVSDNASTDGTQHEVLHLQSKYPKVKYYRNEINLGGTANFHLAIERGTYEHCWLIGDDSIIYPGSIKHIEKILSLHRNAALLFLGGDNQPLSKSLYLRTQYQKQGIFFEVKDRSDFLNALSIQQIGCISCLVVHRESWLSTNYLSMPYAFIYPQINSVLELLTSASSVIFSHRLCFVSTKANDEHNIWYLDRAPLSISLEWPWMQHRAMALGFTDKGKGVFATFSRWKLHQCLVLVGYHPYYRETYAGIVKRSVNLFEKTMLLSIFLLAPVLRPIVKRLAGSRMSKVHLNSATALRYVEPDVRMPVNIDGCAKSRHVR